MQRREFCVTLLALSGKFKTKEHMKSASQTSSQKLNVLLVSNTYHVGITTPIPTSPRSRRERPETYLPK
jgi:hypothetical protein